MMGVTCLLLRQSTRDKYDELVWRGEEQQPRQKGEVPPPPRYRSRRGALWSASSFVAANMGGSHGFSVIMHSALPHTVTNKQHTYIQGEGGSSMEGREATVYVDPPLRT